LITSNSYRTGIFIDEKRFGAKCPAIAMHGAYNGTLQNPENCSSNLRNLFAYLKTEEYYSNNFKAMKKHGDKIMIRGDDNYPLYVCENSGKIKDYKPENDLYIAYQKIKCIS
jgi:hypothetical protein